ncbi:MAG: hypothetical protein ACPHOK_07195 [Akkermansiaceae bacterium]
MKVRTLFFYLIVTIQIAGATPKLGERGPAILREIVSQPWAKSWKSATLKNIRLVSEKSDLHQPLNLPPVWSALISGPNGASGHLIWDSVGEGRLVEFSLDDKFEVKDDLGQAIGGVPSFQQFSIVGKNLKPIASGCVPTAAASVVSYWASQKYPSWGGHDKNSPKDLVLRLRSKLNMTPFPDIDGFTANRMALAGAYPSELLKVLRAETVAYNLPIQIELGRFTLPLLKEEIDNSRPALLSCLVRVAHKPQLSWPHEVVGVGYYEIDDVKLVGVMDNFFPTNHKETIRWIRQDAFRSILILRPREEE